MIYGYKRPLYNDENCKEQTRKLYEYQVNYTLSERHGSPKKREVLEELLMTMQKGDVILVEKFIVLADTLHHLMDILKIVKKDGVSIRFIDEGLSSDRILEEDLSTILSHFIRFHSDIIKQSTKLGLETAKSKGKSLGRPKKSDENIKKAIEMYHSDLYTLLDIKNETGISKSTLYRYLENTEV
ncbi:recombinase family protein [Psychrobacillus sp. FJAT-51614]|uniref:Recombinase family protein n=1 Tax=Psychrobacillus mangrovi TaxID=3117745 RepID=A0ABU8F1S3_9BACI